MRCCCRKSLTVNLPDLLILTFAALYPAFALTKTDGAFGMFKTIRERLPLGGLTTCLYCALFWSGLVVYLLWWTPLQPFVFILAIAGLATAVSFYIGMAQQ